MDTSNLKRQILRGIMVGAILGLSIRFILKDSNDSSWLEALPVAGILIGALTSWKMYRSSSNSTELNKSEQSTDIDG